MFIKLLFLQPQSIMKARIAYTLGIFLFSALCIFLTFNRHSKSGYFNYHSEIWADKAGYYVYLPGALKYDFDPIAFPDSMDAKTGHGFTLDKEQGKVITKYTYGVALMQAPFYLLADAFATPLGYERNGFSPIYHWSINVASIFYLIFGLIFLKRFLARNFSNRTAILTALVVFLGTNLFYYGIDETGMSHVYSFCLFSAFLVLSQATNYLAKTNFWKTLAFGILVGLIVLIRPTNILFLFSFLFINATAKTEILDRIKRLLHYKQSLILVVMVALALVPQMLYWHAVGDSYFSYSYGEEGFNWLSPKLLQTWFSPNNGLLLYAPLFLVLLLASFRFLRVSRLQGWYFIGTFLVLSYVFASWWNWTFGCGFGARSFVEYLALFSLPLAALINRAAQWKKVQAIGLTIVLLLLVAYNLKMTYSYDGCFYGTGAWDWSAYLDHLSAPTK